MQIYPSFEKTGNEILFSNLQHSQILSKDLDQTWICQKQSLIESSLKNRTKTKKDFTGPISWHFVSNGGGEV